jgi:hypothetical protein
MLTTRPSSYEVHGYVDFFTSQYVSASQVALRASVITAPQSASNNSPAIGQLSAVAMATISRKQESWFNEATAVHN